MIFARRVEGVVFGDLAALELPVEFAVTWLLLAPRSNDASAGLRYRSERV
jgi:hypothetical protein